MKQELIDRMENFVRYLAGLPGSPEARAIVAELDKPDYLAIARKICAKVDREYASGMFDNGPPSNTP